MTHALYSIAAVDPASGNVVELEVAAQSPREAKEKAEHSGLRFVIVRDRDHPHRNGRPHPPE